MKKTKKRKSYFGSMPNIPEFKENDRLDRV